jgi:hypothetical protein
MVIVPSLASLMLEHVALLGVHCREHDTLPVERISFQLRLINISDASGVCQFTLDFRRISYQVPGSKLLIH